MSVASRARTAAAGPSAKRCSRRPSSRRRARTRKSPSPTSAETLLPSHSGPNACCIARQVAPAAQRSDSSGPFAYCTSPALASAASAHPCARLRCSCSQKTHVSYPFTKPQRGLRDRFPLLAPPTSAGPCRLNSRRAQPIADRRSALSPELRWPLDWVPAKLSPPVDLDPPPPPSSSPRRCSNAAGTGAASKPPSASQSPPDGRCLSRGSPSEHHPVLLPSTTPRHCALSSRQNLCSLTPGANNSSWALASFLCICRR